VQDVVIGIDPGVGGAAAALNSRGVVVSLDDTPTFSAPLGKHRRRVYDTAAMRAMLWQFIEGDHALHVIIERQQPLPKPGMIARFSAGYGFGLWIGLLVGLQIPHTVVVPQRWQRRMLLGQGDSKARALLAASRLFPGLVIPKNRHGRADALLLAEYGRRYLFEAVERPIGAAS